MSTPERPETPVTAPAKPVFELYEAGIRVAGGCLLCGALTDGLALYEPRGAPVGMFYFVCAGCSKQEAKALVVYQWWEGRRHSDAD